QRVAFARLGIFADSFDLQMAERIAGANVDLLQPLVDKSLIQLTNKRRFVMLATLRAFAREQLTPTVIEKLRRRQLELISEIVDRAVEKRIEGRTACYASIEAVLPDIREVVASALQREPVCAARVVCRLRPFWLLPGRVREAQVWLERTLEHRPALPTDVL